MMIRTGIFVEMWLDAQDYMPIPLLCGRCGRGWFICLPDHDAGFMVKTLRDVDQNTFKLYLDGAAARKAADAVYHAQRLVSYCGGGVKWVQKQWKKRRLRYLETL